MSTDMTPELYWQRLIAGVNGWPQLFAALQRGEETTLKIAGVTWKIGFTSQAGLLNARAWFGNGVALVLMAQNPTKQTRYARMQRFYDECYDLDKLVNPLAIHAHLFWLVVERERVWDWQGYVEPNGVYTPTSDLFAEERANR